MKKILLTLNSVILLFICACIYPAFCQNTDKTFNIHTDGAYMISINERPLELKVTNEKVIRVEVITDLYSPESQIVIRSFGEGISYINFKTRTKSHSIKVLVDNNSPVDTDLTEIDKVKEP